MEEESLYCEWFWGMEGGGRTPWIEVTCCTQRVSMYRSLTKELPWGKHLMSVPK